MLHAAPTEAPQPSQGKGVAEGLASVPLARVEELDERLEERLVDPRRACAAAKITLTAALWLLRRVEA